MPLGLKPWDSRAFAPALSLLGWLELSTGRRLTLGAASLVLATGVWGLTGMTGLDEPARLPAGPWNARPVGVLSRAHAEQQDVVADPASRAQPAPIGPG